MSPPLQLVWLITGTSTGIGRSLAEVLLERGEKVIATARGRSFDKIVSLRAKGADILELDVTASLEDLKEITKRAMEIHGRVDVLVNNAGYLLTGSIEENTPEETLQQYNTNLFGAINVARVFLPYMRERRRGTIVWIGSQGGHYPAVGAALYCSTKAAMRSISLAMHLEMSSLSPDIRSTCIDFGNFQSDVMENGNRTGYLPRIADYKSMISAADQYMASISRKQPGDPDRGANVVIDIVKGEGQAAGKPWPVNGVVLGSDAYSRAKDAAESLLKDVESWRKISCSTDFPENQRS